MKLQAETNEKLIFEKTDDLISKITNFSDSLPNGEIFSLKDRLKYCLVNIPNVLYNSFYGGTRTERIRHAIRVFEALADCKDYLTLAEKLRYADTDELIMRVDDIYQLLVMDYPLAVDISKAS